jgi:hypothetical protein
MGDTVSVDKYQVFRRTGFYRTVQYGSFSEPLVFVPDMFDRKRVLLNQSANGFHNLGFGTVICDNDFETFKRLNFEPRQYEFEESDIVIE